MADINTVIGKIADAYHEALDVAGLPHPADEIAALQAQIATLQAENTAQKNQIAVVVVALNAVIAGLTA